MAYKTFLAKSFVDAVLERAKENLTTYGSLVPVLFLRFDNGQWVIKALQLPETHERRILYVLRLRLDLHRHQGLIREALMLSEGWYEEIQPVAGMLALLRKPKTARREGIVLVGRDANRLRYTHVVQPFHRNDQGAVVFDPLTLARYEHAYTAQAGPVGLVDYLFSNHRKGGDSYEHGTGVPASTQ